MGNIKTDNLVRKDLLLACCGCCVGKRRSCVLSSAQRNGMREVRTGGLQKAEFKFCSHRLWSPDLDSGKWPSNSHYHLRPPGECRNTRNDGWVIPSSGSPYLYHQLMCTVLSLQRWAWFAIQNIVRSICKFHREMNNNKCRVEFEDFLWKELENEEESMARLLNTSLPSPRQS